VGAAWTVPELRNQRKQVVLERSSRRGSTRAEADRRGSVRAEDGRSEQDVTRTKESARLGRARMKLKCSSSERTRTEGSEATHDGSSEGSHGGTCDTTRSERRAGPASGGVAKSGRACRRSAHKGVEEQQRQL
jgi:hypothetical protein